MTLALEGRLLCASLHAYEIAAAGIVPPCAAWTPNPSSLIGWLAAPTAYVAGADGIDAVLVGETLTEIILAFRGTEPINAPDPRQAVLDWLSDFNAVLVEDPHQPGMVHCGFNAAVNGLWPLFWPKVKAMAAASPGKTLAVCGHSKGGAIAPLAAVRLAGEGLKPHVVTFAGARCGNHAFAEAYAKRVPASLRYEVTDDLVPHVPLSGLLGGLLKAVPWLRDTVDVLTLGYASVGALRFIDWHGKIVGESPLLEIHRAERLVELLAEGGFGRLGSDHDLSPGGGYATAICSGVWRSP